MYVYKYIDIQLFLILCANSVFLIFDACRSGAERGAGRGKTRRSGVEEDGVGRNCAGWFWIYNQKRHTNTNGSRSLNEKPGNRDIYI